MTPGRVSVERILCPVDFSDFSGASVERAVRLAKWFGARVELLHVVPFDPLASWGSGSPYGPAIIAGDTQNFAQDLADLALPWRDAGVPIEIKLLEGNPWRVIREEAELWPADLLVMGTHGRSEVERLLLGSVTEKVLRSVTCPILMAGQSVPPPRKRQFFRRILCASDLAPGSQRTLDTALALANENGARVVLVHVIESTPALAGRGPSPLPEISLLQSKLVDQAHNQLREVLAHAQPNLCEVTERVETGTAWSEILRVASEMNADLIIVGAHACGAVGRMLFGSTASQVVRQASCPVLVLRDRQGRPSVVETANAAVAKAVAPQTRKHAVLTASEA